MRTPSKGKLQDVCVRCGQLMTRTWLSVTQWNTAQTDLLTMLQPHHFMLTPGQMWNGKMFWFFPLNFPSPWRLAPFSTVKLYWSFSKTPLCSFFFWRPFKNSLLFQVYVRIMIDFCFLLIRERKFLTNFPVNSQLDAYVPNLMDLTMLF